MKLNGWRALLVPVVVLSLSVLRTIPAAADSISVFPGTMSFPNALRGSDIYQAITIVNDNDSGKTYGFSAEGDLANWVTFVDVDDRTKALDTIDIDAHSQAKALVKLHIPETTANGNFAGRVTVFETVTNPETKKNSIQNVSLAAAIRVDGSVTGTQEISALLRDLAVTDTEVGVPFSIKATIQSTGNVEITPRINLRVTNEKGAVIDQTSFADQPIGPGETRDVVARWDTKDALPGKYSANIGVDFGGFDLGTQERLFTIFQRGTLTRSGTLETLTLTNKPAPGGTAKIFAGILNDGAIEARAVFTGEVTLAGQLVKAIETPPILVQSGQRTTVTVFVDVAKKGTYHLSGKVNFEGKESATKELDIAVGVEKGGGTSPLIYGIPALVLALILIIVAKWRWGGGFHRRRSTTGV